MLVVYFKWSTRGENPQPVELFAKLADLESVENVSPIIQHSEFDFDLNVGWTDQLECGRTLQMSENPNYGGSSYNNHTPGPHLQIHLEVIISTKADVRERTNNGEDFDQDVEDFSDPDIDEVLNDIDDEGPKKIEDVHGSSFNNPSYGIVLRNELGGDILKVDPNAVHAFEFPEYADIVPAHRLTSNS
ncbi:hypothetical protein PVK06_047782 [Gossypium arboreum]|uniref:Peptidylprolyl isomerase n=1 Tax=Gossypium arboreum TaxID=29729 RepID=A0ABR0MEC2_GOSAR|nr:hypothetical protein PVK06_047782 [Gossypium arboreum]